MAIDKILEERKKAIAASIRRLNAELADVDVALEAISANRKVNHLHFYTLPHVLSDDKSGMNRDMAILEAIMAGCNKPSVIFNYVESHLGIDTTINSVRTRLTKLKNAGEIANGSDGWIPLFETKKRADIENELP